MKPPDFFLRLTYAHPGLLLGIFWVVVVGLAVVWPGATDNTLPSKIRPRYPFPRECGQPFIQDILTTRGGAG